MTFDFIVFDGAVGYETTSATTYYVGRSFPAIVRTVLTATPSRVRDLENKFGQLWATAEPPSRARE